MVQRKYITYNQVRFRDGRSGIAQADIAAGPQTLSELCREDPE